MSVVEVIEDILDQTYLGEECRTDSLIRIYDEDCYCIGWIKEYTVKCMEEEVKVFR